MLDAPLLVVRLMQFSKFNISILASSLLMVYFVKCSSQFDYYDCHTAPTLPCYVLWSTCCMAYALTSSKPMLRVRYQFSQLLRDPLLDWGSDDFIESLREVKNG